MQPWMPHQDMFSDHPLPLSFTPSLRAKCFLPSILALMESWCNLLLSIARGRLEPLGERLMYAPQSSPIHPAIQIKRPVNVSTRRARHRARWLANLEKSCLNRNGRSPPICLSIPLAIGKTNRATRLMLHVRIRIKDIMFEPRSILKLVEWDGGD